MIKDARVTRSQILAARLRVTELLVELDADQVEQTPESQAWSALADAYQKLSTALAFVDALDPDHAPAPAPKVAERRGLWLVR